MKRASRLNTLDVMGTALRLATPPDQLASHYDAVIVGSGYGGGVAACRLSRLGLSVCVLERGREFLPGDFSSDWRYLRKNIRFCARRWQVGSPAGLYHFHLGADINVLTANGLGGGSLINGAVALRPPMGLFLSHGWPEVLATDGLLPVALDTAEQMLGVSSCPDVDELPKLRGLKRAAAHRGAEIEHAPTTITYDARINAANIEQAACRLCGGCWSGCNVGAKNTIPVTYLADAALHGAKIFTLASVKLIEKLDDRWKIGIEDTLPQQGSSRRRPKYITAERVILAAGTLGTTEILLRSQEHGLRLSDKLGQNFSGNGDEMIIGRDLDTTANAVAVGFPPRAIVDPVGPATVAVIRPSSEAETEPAVILQDGTMLPFMAMMAPLKALMEGDWKRAFMQLREGPYQGYRSRAQIFYSVAHDRAQGRMRLSGDRIILEWPEIEDDPCFAQGLKAAEDLIQSLGGTAMKNPLSDRLLGGRKITAHPLGGCAMGETVSSGVVDHRCQVFDGENQTSTHRGLYVCDGSIMRGSLGVNPLLTITALAERAMMLLASHERR